MANAKYNGTLFFESIPSENKAKGAVAQAVVRMPLQVAVAVTGKQILKGVVDSITTADVDVSLDGATLATEELSFTVLTSGTLTREGELKKLTIKGVPQVDRVIKVVAIFENTGEGDIIAEFKGELYHNGEFVDVLKSEEKLVESGDMSEITVYYKIMAPGDYQTKGYVTYSGKETQKEEVSFTVSEEVEAKEVAKVEKKAEEEQKAAEEEKKGIPVFEFVTGLIAIAIVSLLVSVYRRERGRH